jgi:pimeloyl-ACP methyl ester carboxylesterase
MSGSVHVRGGSHSISVEFEQLRVLGHAFAAAAEQLTDTLGAAMAALTNSALITAGVLDPIGAAEVAENAGISAVLAGSAAAGCAAMASTLEAAAVSYRVADNLDGRLEPALQGLLHAPSAMMSMSRWQPGAITSLPQTFAEAISADPALADLVIDATAAPNPPELLAELFSPSRGVSETSTLAGMLAGWYDDGSPLLAKHPSDPTDDAAGPPRSMADLIRGLSLRSDNNAGGAVDVRIVTTAAPDGTATRAAIVNITGTTEWGLTRRSSKTVSNLATNLRTVGNERSTYEAGVVLALRDSGIRPNEPIMLVGHSQGGLVAARLAADLAGSPEFRVTHLVTAGAPIGLIDVPPAVQVLSLENAGDVVPELDGTLNPTRSNQVTVKVDRGGPGTDNRHDLASGYLPAAADVDACGDGSVVDWMSGTNAFLGGTNVSTQVFQITRQP